MEFRGLDTHTAIHIDARSGRGVSAFRPLSSLIKLPGKAEMTRTVPSTVLFSVAVRLVNDSGYEVVCESVESLRVQIKEIEDKWNDVYRPARVA